MEEKKAENLNVFVGKNICFQFVVVGGVVVVVGGGGGGVVFVDDVLVLCIILISITTTVYNILLLKRKPTKSLSTLSRGNFFFLWKFSALKISLSCLCRNKIRLQYVFCFVLQMPKSSKCDI